MRFSTGVKYSHSGIKLSYKSKVVLLGSCFSDNIGKKLSDNYFKCNYNPFGTIFHPLALSNLLKSVQTKETYTFKNGDNYNSWLASNKLAFTGIDKIENWCKNELNNLEDSLNTCTHLFITLGTAYGYRNNKTGKIVSNCHKVNPKEFTKELSGIKEMVDSIETQLNLIREKNPDINVIITVSPVIHEKDGLIENKRSKSRITEACHMICENLDYVHYFPSQEYISDELRDYRFYNEDLVHPNSIAIKYIWNKITEHLMNPETQDELKTVDKYNNFKNHKIQNQTEANLLNYNKKLKELESKLPITIN
jgi:hypothetical protein